MDVMGGPAPEMDNDTTMSSSKSTDQIGLLDDYDGSIQDFDTKKSKNDVNLSWKEKLWYGYLFLMCGVIIPLLTRTRWVKILAGLVFWD